MSPKSVFDFYFFVLVRCEKCWSLTKKWSRVQVFTFCEVSKFFVGTNFLKFWSFLKMHHKSPINFSRKILNIFLKSCAPLCVLSLWGCPGCFLRVNLDADSKKTGPRSISSIFAKLEPFLCKNVGIFGRF